MSSLSSPGLFETQNAPSSPLNEEALILLARATELLGNCTNYEATLEYVANLLVSSLACWCTIDLVNDEGKIERVAGTHRDPKKVEMVKLIRQKYPPRPSATRGVYKVIASAQSILIPHISEMSWMKRAESAEHLQLIMDLGSSSYMCIPLIARGHVVGSIMLCSGERVYTPEDLSTAEHLARCIAMAVDNVHMFRKMEATQAQLVQTAKLAALGAISAGIAHEINNPLTIIKGHLKHFEILLTKNESIPAEKFKNSAEKIHRNIDRIVKIVRHVKDFSRQSDKKFSTFEWQGLIEAALSLFEQQFFINDIEVHTHLPAKSVFARGDFNRLEQVLVNLLGNAKDAINTREGRRGGKIHLRLLTSETKTSLEITDDGVGMSSSLQERIFEPFFTTKEVGKGTGLGLSISHGIIKDHGGAIHFKSREGLGTTVLIELPNHSATPVLQ